MLIAQEAGGTGAERPARPPRDSNDWLTSEYIANDLQIPLNTWYQWRSAGKGPKAIKVGKHVRVRRKDYESWLATLQEVR